MSVKRELRRRFRQLLVVWIGGLIVIAASAGCTDGVDSQAFPDPPSPTSTGCELPARLAEAVELGVMTEEEACRTVRKGEQATEARQGAPDFPEGPSLVVEGSVNQEWVAQCRTGSFPVGEGY